MLLYLICVPTDQNPLFKKEITFCITMFYITIDYERRDFPIPEAYKFNLNEHIEAVLN